MSPSIPRTAPRVTVCSPPRITGSFSAPRRSLTTSSSRLRVSPTSPATWRSPASCIRRSSRSTPALKLWVSRWREASRMAEGANLVPERWVPVASRGAPKTT